MPVPNVPTKTALGHDELRLRKHGLGQRYRTILLLIDGRRPLSEVLSLAQQAGSQTSHFEELVRLGMVEVPEDAAAGEPVITEAGALDALRVTEVEVLVPALEPEPAPPVVPKATTPPAALIAPPAPKVVQPAAAAAAPALAAVVPMPVAAPAPAKVIVQVPVAAPRQPPTADTAAPAVAKVPAPAQARKAPPPTPAAPVESDDHDLPLLSASRIEALTQLVNATPPRPTTGPSRKAAAAKTPAPQAVPPAPAPRAAAKASAAKAPAAATPVVKSKGKPAAAPRAAAPPAPKAAPAASPAPTPAESEEDQVVSEVRELLRQTLHYDPPSFGSKLYGRVSNAGTVKELVDLAWELERQPNHARRSRAGMWTLQRARELLGLGNTLVQDSWEQDVWQDTRPPAPG